MRTVAEIRARQMETLANVLRRPGMYSNDASGIDSIVWHILKTLLFIDKKESE